MKYDNVTFNGLELEPDEPFFILRGKDKAAFRTIEFYSMLTGTRRPETLNAFETWANNNPDKMKVAD